MNFEDIHKAIHSIFSPRKRGRVLTKLTEPERAAVDMILFRDKALDSEVDRIVLIKRRLVLDRDELFALIKKAHGISQENLDIDSKEGVVYETVPNED